MRTQWMLSLAMLAGVMTPSAWGKSSWPYWQRYAERFITPEGRVVDPDRSAMTTSEGQSYALFFSLVANDPRSFQKILTWTEDHLAQGRIASNLPAWSWGRNSDNQWGVLDANSASDSDLWIAYSLIQAGTLWHRPDYAAKGASLLHRIAWEEVVEVPRLGPVLLPGKTGFQTADTWTLNPSYLPLPLLCASASVDPRGPWKQMARNLPYWLEESSQSGFAMDWVQCNLTSCQPVPGPGNTTGAPRGSYDAIRVYLWAGIANKDTPGNKRLLKVFSPMLTYMKAHPQPPESVAANGAILSASGPASFAAALIPFAFNSGEYSLTSQLRQRVTASLSPSTGLLGNPARYYDLNLALFALGWQQRYFRFAPDGTLKVPWKT